MSDTNALGLQLKDYQGARSTLCTGCGHDSITSAIIKACFQNDVQPQQLIKLSGIGCSSKTPTYFMNGSFGFNSVHGRMAPLTTGALMAKHDLKAIGISGDGDTASIGLGGFMHLVRRNLPMVYIIENNGVYGLTKGQFSATADKDSVSKSGKRNPFIHMDLCALAIQLDAPFVARAFSGDAKQLAEMLKAALHCAGTAVIDIVSPCVTFANNEGSTKSFNYVKDHRVALNELGVVPTETEISADYEEGEVFEVKMHDGSSVWLKKAIPAEHKIDSKISVLQAMESAYEDQQILTGLLYYHSQGQSLFDQMNLSARPLRDLSQEDLKLKPSELLEVLADYR